MKPATPSLIAPTVLNWMVGALFLYLQVGQISQVLKCR